MKKTIILLILLFGALIVDAKSIEQEINYLDSYEVPGHNITLIGVGDDKKLVVLCVNNERYIVNRKHEVEINDIKIEPLTIYDLSVKLKIIYSNEELTCGESCSNAVCVGQVEEVENDEETEVEEVENDEETEVEEVENESGSLIVPSVGLMVLVIILLLIFFSKKKR